MGIDASALRSAASRAAHLIQSQCCGADGGTKFNKIKAESIIISELEPVVKDAVKKAERRATRKLTE